MSYVQFDRFWNRARFVFDEADDDGVPTRDDENFFVLLRTKTVKWVVNIFLKINLPRRSPVWKRNRFRRIVENYASIVSWGIRKKTPRFSRIPRGLTVFSTTQRPVFN